MAQTARILKLPVVLTSSMEEYAQGPLLSELKAILPAEFSARIKRSGIVNAMDDKNFAAAVKATGRKKLIVAGVTNDVCTVYPALSLVREGFEVQVVADGVAANAVRPPSLPQKLYLSRNVVSPKPRRVTRLPPSRS